jgi:heat shock protein HslJ
MRRLALVAAAAAVIATACGTVSPGSVGGAWILVEGTHPDGPIDWEGGTTPVLRLYGDEISGEGPCNFYSGHFRVNSSGRFEIVDGLAVTERACADASAMEAERRFFDALSSATTFTVEGTRLVLSGDGHQLTFSRDQSAPSTTAPSSGSPDEPVTSDRWFPEEAFGSWELESGALDGRVIPLVDSHPVTLMVEPGRLGGTVCNSYGASPPEGGGELEIVQTLMACMEPNVMESEGMFLDALRRFTSATVEGDRMVVVGDGVELVFRPADDGRENGSGVSTDDVVSRALADLAERLDIDADAIRVVEAGRVTWSDGSLGCPEPGVAYTEALVDGWRVILEHGGARFSYHAGPDGEPFLCDRPLGDGGFIEER